MFPYLDTDLSCWMTSTSYVCFRKCFVHLDRSFSVWSIRMQSERAEAHSIRVSEKHTNVPSCLSCRIKQFTDYTTGMHVYAYLCIISLKWWFKFLKSITILINGWNESTLYSISLYSICTCFIVLHGGTTSMLLQILL